MEETLEVLRLHQSDLMLEEQHAQTYKGHMHLIDAGTHIKEAIDALQKAIAVETEAAEARHGS